MYIVAFKARILCSSEKQTPKIYWETKMYELMIVHKKQKKNESERAKLLM